MPICDHLWNPVSCCLNLCGDSSSAGVGTPQNHGFPGISRIQMPPLIRVICVICGWTSLSVLCLHSWRPWRFGGSHSRRLGGFVSPPSHPTTCAVVQAWLVWGLQNQRIPRDLTDTNASPHPCDLSDLWLDFDFRFVSPLLASLALWRFTFPAAWRFGAAKFFTAFSSDNLCRGSSLACVGTPEPRIPRISRIQTPPLIRVICLICGWTSLSALCHPSWRSWRLGGSHSRRLGGFAPPRLLIRQLVPWLKFG